MHSRGWIFIAAFSVASCATAEQSSRPAATAQDLMQSGPACSQDIPESKWAELPAACRGNLMLDRSERAAVARQWEQSLSWANRAQQELKPPLSYYAQFHAAESSYALGNTVAASTGLKAVLGYGLDPSTAAEAHYYLAEMAFSANDATGVVVHLGAALEAAPDAGWRLAAESLLTLAARNDVDWESTQGSIPENLKALGLYLHAESELRAHRQDQALKLYKSLAGDPVMAKLGLAHEIVSRIEDLESRGVPRPGAVGVVLPLSGRAAPFGVTALRGILLGLDPFANPSFELLIENDRGEPFRSVRALRLVAHDGAVAAIGPLLGKSVEAGVDVAQTIGLPTVVLSSAELPPLAPWVVRVAVTPAEQVERLLQETMDRRGFKRFAILHAAGPFGKGMRDIFWDAVIARGGQITAVEEYESGGTDFKVPIRRLIAADEFTPDEVKKRKAANQPLAHLDFDAVFIPGSARTVGLILPQLLYFDVRGPLFMGPSTWNDPALIEMARDYAEGSLFVDWYRPEETNAETTRFANAYEKAYGSSPAPSVAALGYEAGRLMSGAVKEGTRPGVRDALYKSSWKSFYGSASVRADGEVVRKLELLTVTDRKIVPLDDNPGQ
jgi:ABC-type branched-subunit amino acid transport system substrate-binding protein